MTINQPETDQMPEPEVDMTAGPPPPEPEPEPPVELIDEGDGLTPKRIVAKYKKMLDRDQISRSRSGVAEQVRSDLAEYHQRRGWGEPTVEQVMELVREVL